MLFGKSILAALAVGLVLGLPEPAVAAPAKNSLFPALSAGTEPPVLHVDNRRGHRGYRGYKGYRGRGYYGNKRYPYYNGHRGYRNHRRGYRQYYGWWFPPAAFTYRYRVLPPQRYITPPPLVIVPPTVAPAAPLYGSYLSPAHYQWCDQRYRSYRAVDNSFQPYHGPRRACVSPYGP